MQAADFAERLAQIYRADSARTRAQCDAVMAFSVRVASAAILNLSQVALARWMGVRVTASRCSCGHGCWC
jgi:hypothetical protein